MRGVARACVDVRRRGYDTSAALADAGVTLAGLAIEVGLLALAGLRVARVGDAFTEVVAGDVQAVVDALARHAGAGSTFTRTLDRRVDAVSSVGVAHAVVALGVILVTDVGVAQITDDAFAAHADTGLILAKLAVEVGLLALAALRVALVGDAFAEVVAGDV